MHTDEDPDLPIEVDADGYRVDHRSETEQSSQAKEVHEYSDRTEIRLRDEKEVRLEEVKSRETTRRATYDDIIALLDAQLDDLDEIQTSREVTIQEFNRVETTRETVTGGELKREIRTTDEKRKEEILEGPSDTKRVVTTETETLVVQPSPGALSLHETESPLSQVSERSESSSDQPRSLVIDTGLGTEPVRGGFNVGITPGEAEFRIRSEGLGGKAPEKTERAAVWIPKQDKGSLTVQGDVNFAENTGSLHRIQHRAHRIEELIVEDVDTFYEDQTRPPKRHSGLLGVKKEKRGKSQSPPSTLEKRPKTEDIKVPTTKEERLMIELKNVTPRPSPERPAQPAGVSISAVPPRTDIVIHPDVRVDSGLSDIKPRAVIVDPQDGNTNRFTYVVTYDSPGGVKIRDSGKRKKDVHPKKKKDKRRLGKQQPETENDMPADTEFVTYVVNYDRTEPLDGDNKPPRTTVITKPEASFPEPSVSREPRAADNAKIEVDMHAGEVKVMEPVKVLEERQGDSRTFVVNYEIPAPVEKSAKPGKPRKELQEARVPYSGNRQPPNEEFTYIVNYDTPSVTPVVPPTSIETYVESPAVENDSEKKAPVYSITVVEPGPGVSVEKARKSPEKPGKKQGPGSKDPFELTYIVNYDEPLQGSLDDTDNLPRKEGGADVWIRPSTFEAKVRGKEEIKVKPAKLKGAPETADSLTYVVEYEREADEKAKDGIPVPKLKKKGSSTSDDVVEKMYTYIVNYDQPSSLPRKKEKKKKEEKKGKDVKATLKVEEPHLQKSYDIKQPSPELSFTVQHPYPEPITQPEIPTSELSITVQHPMPEPEIREQSQEYSIIVDHPFPEPVTQPEEHFEEYSIIVDHPIPEPVTQPEEHFEEYSIIVDHPFPEPVTPPEEHFEEYSITVDHPIPEPVTQPQEHFEEYSITVDHPIPEPVTPPEDQFEEFSFAVEHPTPEPVTPPEDQFEEFFMAAEHPFPEPVTQPKEHFEEFSITIDRPIPEAHLEIEEPVLPQPKLPEPIPSKVSGESLTYIVNYDTPTKSGEGKPTKTKTKRKPWSSKGSKPSAKAEVAAETSPDIGKTFTYIVNYDEPSVRPEVPKPAKTEKELFGKAEVKAPKLEIESSAKISGPKEKVGQSEALSITVTQPMPTISTTTPASADIAVSESAEGITYIVHHEEPVSVGLTGGKHKKIPRKEAELKIRKPAEEEHEIGVLPEESAMPLPASGLTIVVEHPEPKTLEIRGGISGKASPTAETLTYVVNYDQPIGKPDKVKGTKGKRGIEGKKSQATVEVDAPKVAVKTPEALEVGGGISGKASPTSETLTYVVNYDQPLGKTEKIKGAKGKLGIEGKKPRATVEVEAPKVVVKTPEPPVITSDVPKLPSVSESVSFTVVHDQPELPEASSSIVTDGQWRPESSKEMTFVVNYDLPSRTEQDVEVAEIEVEAPATIELAPSTENVSLELRNVQLPTAPEEPQRNISVNIERPYIPPPSLPVPATTGESFTYIVNYDEPRAKTRKEKPVKGKAKEKGWAFQKKKPSAGVDIEGKGASLSTETYEVYVTTDQPAVSAEVSTGITTPTATVSKKTGKDVATDQVTYIVNYDRSHKVIRIPEVRDTTAIEVEAEDIPQIEPFEIPEPEVEIEEPSSRLTITVEEPLPEVSAEVELPSPEIGFKVKEPVAPIVTAPDIGLPKGGTAETITYVVTHEEPATKISGKVKPDKKEKKGKFAFPGKKIPKDVKAGASVEAQRPEVTAEIAGGVPLYEITVKTEKLEPSVDVKQKKPEVSATTPEAAISVTKPSEDFDVQAQAQPQSITYVVNYDDSEKVIPKSKIKGTKDIKGKKIAAPKVKPPKVPKGKITSGESESMTYVVTYDDAGKFVPPPEIKESAALKFEVQDIPEIKAPEIPQAAVDIEEPSSELTITIEQPVPEISAEVKPPTPEIKIREPSEVEQFTITVEQPQPEISAEVRPPTPEIKIREPSEVEQFTITVEQPLPEVSTEVKLPTPEVKVKKPAKAVVTPPSVELPQADTLQTFTYIVTHDEPSLKISGEAKPEKTEKKKRGFGFPTKKISKELKVEGEVEAKGPKAGIETAIGVPIYEVTVITDKPKPGVQIETKKPEVSIETSKPVIEAPAKAESLTYVVTYDDSRKVSPLKIKEPAAIEVQTKEIPHIKVPEIPEAEVELEEPSSQLTIEVEHPLPDVSAEVKAPTPEIKVKGPSEFVVKPPSVEIRKAGATAETITYIVNHEEPALKISGEVKPEKKEKKRGLVFPGKKVPKDVKAGGGVKVKGPEVAAEIAEGVPLYEVSVTTEQKEPSVDVKKKKKKPQGSVIAISITKPPADTAAHEETQSQSVTYVVTYDGAEKVIPTPAKKTPAIVEVKTKAIPKLAIPEIPEAKLEVEEPSSQLTITVLQPLPEISAEVKPPTPEIKVKAPTEVEQLTITVEQPLPEISAEVKPPTPEIKIREPSEVEQLTITVEQPQPEISAQVKPPTPEIKIKEQPLPEVSTKVKLPTPEVKVRKPSEIAVGTPSVELSKKGTAETFTYIVTHEDRPSKISKVAEPEKKEKKKKMRFPGKYFGRSKKYEVTPEAELQEPEVSDVTKGKEKPITKAHIKAKKPAIDLSKEEVVTYVVNYDDTQKVAPVTEIKPPEIPESKFKVEEPSSHLTISVEQPLPDISAKVKPPTPEIKIREPSEVEQLTISVEQPLPEVSTEVKPPIAEVKVKKPFEVAVGTPSVELSKKGTAETFTYIVTHEDRPSKISADAEPEKKEKKKKIRFPGKYFGRSKKYEVTPEAELQEPEVSDVTKGKEKPITKAHIKAKKPAVDLSKEEVVTYVVKYDDSSKVAPAVKIKAPEIPESKFKVEEPSSQLTISVEQPLPEISAEVKPPTPEIKLKEPSEVEQLTITVEQPQPEISAEVKPPTPEIKMKEPSEVEQLTITMEPLPEIIKEVPTPEIKIREPSDVEQLTITVESPIPEVSTQVKPTIPEVKVKKPSEVAVGTPSVELSKGGTAETFTYIVTHEDRPSKISEVAEPEKKEKKKKILFPGKYFGRSKKYEVTAEAELKEPKVSDVKKGKEKPMTKAHIKAKKPAVDLSKQEVITYVVNYDDKQKVAPVTEIKSPEIPESKFKVEEPSSQLTISVEQPLPDISAKVKPPTPEIKLKEPSEVEQLTITVEQPLPEISAEVKSPTPEIKIKEPSEIEQLTITVEQPQPEISAEINPPTPEIKEPSEVEQLTITMETLPEIIKEVPTPEIKIREPSEIEQYSITVEQPLPEITAEVKPPTPEIKVKAPTEIAVKPPSVEIPKAGTTETVTYIVNHEEPTIKVSGEVKPQKKEKKQAGIRLPGKKVPKDLKAGAGIAAKGPTTEVSGETPIYEVTVTTEQPALPVEPEAAAIPGAKGGVALKDGVETVTYVVEHEKEQQAKEALSAEGEKKRKDWIWRVKKPSKSIDISTESQEPEAGISAKIGEPTFGISAEAETPGRDISISAEKPKVAQEISQLSGVPETHTYIVNYGEPQVTAPKGKLKAWPFSRKTPAGKLEAKAKPKKNKWTLFKKKEPKVVKPRVDIELAEITPPDVILGETIRGDVDVSVPAAPSIALEQKETIAGDVSGTVELPAAPEYSVTVTHEEDPSAESVIAPHPELTIPEADLEIGAEKKPTDVSQVKYDVEAKLPGRKEQVFAEKVVTGKVTVTDAEAERTEPRDKDRSVISGGRREEENAEEETVVYIVNYEQPFGTLTKTRDGAKEATPGLKPEVAAEAEKPDDVTNIKHSVQVQMPQLEQCILVPIRDESSPEDSFYGTEAPVPAWPPVDEPVFEEDVRPDDVSRKVETSAVDIEKQLPPHLVVVAVDFGTTFSGYAFSFSRDSAGSIHVMRKWEGGDPGAVDHKTPTILLLTPIGQFHSFGFTARDFYHDLSPKEAARWLYFEKFKMALHFNAELNTDTKLAAANGQCVPAIDVFTHALRFFRKHVLQEVSDQVSTDVLNEDIYWIITVPAIWTEEAKQFMRLAAYRAGIASPNYPDQLLISLEPEAASIYVRKQRLHQLVPEVPFQRRRSCRRSVTPEPTAVNQPIVTSERKVLPTDSGQLVRTTTTVTVSWPVVTTIPQTDITVGHQVDTAGTRYMVVDCGGGTVDITVHEIQSRDGTLRELHRATGGPFGSVAVDQEFEKLLVEIFGVDFIDVFKAKRPAGWVDLLMAFESRKRAANPYNTKPLNVSLPFSFIDYHKKYRNCPVEHAIRKYGNRDIRWSSQGMLRLMPEAMNRLFLPAIDKIKEAIGNVLNDSEVKGLRFLFLVGGFADSPMLQLAIRQEFGHLLRIIIPNDASISILKGAVCFGLDPTVITTRKSRMTYGVGVLNRFVPGQHPPSKLILKDGEEWCTDVFDALVYADQSVAIGDTVLRRYTLVPGDADDVIVSKVVNIYSSDRRDVKYVTERGVTRCGTLCLTDDDSKKPSASRQQHQKDREVQVRMTFGHTEIKVTAFELGTRKSVRATIDFLNK